jgi:hypothetical protein
MSGPSGRLREVCVLTFLLVFAAVFRSDAGSAPATPSSQRQYAQSRELAAAAQDEDTPRRPRRKSRPTPEEAREKSEAAKRAALEELQKKFPSLNKGSPSAGAPSQGGAPGANRRTPSGPGEG